MELGIAFDSQEAGKLPLLMRANPTFGSGRAPYGAKLALQDRQRSVRVLEFLNPKVIGERLGVARETVTRAASGCSVRKITAVAIVAGLDALEAEAQR